MKQSIFIDFDGTIVDVWERYYSVFKEISKDSELSFHTYKSLRKMGYTDEGIAVARQIYLPKGYKKLKSLLLEQEKYLVLDTMLVERHKLISFVFETNAKILTKRRNQRMFYWQIQYLGLTSLGRNYIILDNVVSKKDWLRSVCSNGEIIMVGDSKQEIEVAELENSVVILVRTGFFLSDLGKKIPNLILVEDINSGISLIKEKYL